jgi:hypothetical protein
MTLQLRRFLILIIVASARHSHRIGVLARANMLDWGKHSLPEGHVPTSGEESRLAQIRR